MSRRSSKLCGLRSWHKRSTSQCGVFAWAVEAYHGQCEPQGGLLREAAHVILGPSEHYHVIPR